MYTLLIAYVLNELKQYLLCICLSLFAEKSVDLILYNKDSRVEYILEEKIRL